MACSLKRGIVEALKRKTSRQRRLAKKRFALPDQTWQMIPGHT